MNSINYEDFVSGYFTQLLELQKQTLTEKDVFQQGTPYDELYSKQTSRKITVCQIASNLLLQQEGKSEGAEEKKIKEKPSFLGNFLNRFKKTSIDKKKEGASQNSTILLSPRKMEMPLSPRNKEETPLSPRNLLSPRKEEKQGISIAQTTKETIHVRQESRSLEKFPSFLMQDSFEEDLGSPLQKTESEEFNLEPATTLSSIVKRPSLILKTHRRRSSSLNNDRFSKSPTQLDSPVIKSNMIMNRTGSYLKTVTKMMEIVEIKKSFEDEAIQFAIHNHLEKHLKEDDHEALKKLFKRCPKLISLERPLHVIKPVNDQFSKTVSKNEAIETIRDRLYELCVEMHRKYRLRKNLALFPKKILRYPLAIEKFREFLVKNKNEPNLDFMVAAQNYKKAYNELFLNLSSYQIQSFHSLFEKAVYIYQKFCNLDAKTTINLNSNVFNQIQFDLRNANALEKEISILQKEIHLIQKAIKKEIGTEEKECCELKIIRHRIQLALWQLSYLAHPAVAQVKEFYQDWKAFKKKEAEIQQLEMNQQNTEEAISAFRKILVFKNFIEKSATNGHLLFKIGEKAEEVQEQIKNLQLLEKELRPFEKEEEEKKKNIEKGIKSELEPHLEEEAFLQKKNLFMQKLVEFKKLAEGIAVQLQTYAIKSQEALQIARKLDELEKSTHKETNLLDEKFKENMGFLSEETMILKSKMEAVAEQFLSVYGLQNVQPILNELQQITSCTKWVDKMGKTQLQEKKQLFREKFDQAYKILKGLFNDAVEEVNKNLKENTMGFQYSFKQSEQYKELCVLIDQNKVVKEDSSLFNIRTIL